ncbi:MAG: hypothetical protein COB93_02860 [Sneathiella sp.]|nr:MAG: hypothetical protein COB93_02860 [Sneathiella sp.]
MIQPSITVHQFPPFLQMQPSPFGLKLETWLRMRGIPYDIQMSFTKAGPKNKIPFANIDGEVIGDSEIIIDRVQRMTGCNGDTALNDQQKAKGILIRRMVEEHLYFVLMHSRWIDDTGWDIFGPLVFSHIPSLIRPIISRKIRKMVLRNLMSQGISRHSNAEIYAKGDADIRALSALLGDADYFLGEQPDVADASAYGLLANILYAPLESPLCETLRECRNLIDFCDRMRADVWPDSPRGGGE